MRNQHVFPSPKRSAALRRGPVFRVSSALAPPLAAAFAALTVLSASPPVPLVPAGSAPAEVVAAKPQRPPPEQPTVSLVPLTPTWFAVGGAAAVSGSVATSRYLRKARAEAEAAEAVALHEAAVQVYEEAASQAEASQAAAQAAALEIEASQAASVEFLSEVRRVESSGNRRSGSGSASDSDSGKAGRRSYYKQIGGVKFDRAPLDCAEDLAAANGGTLGAEEAKRLLADARDGPGGVTDCEERTLTYIAEKSRLSPGAKEVLGKGDAAVKGARAPAAERGELDLSRYEFPDEVPRGPRSGLRQQEIPNQTPPLAQGVAKAEATKNAVLKVAGGKGMPLPRAGEDGGLPSFSGLSRTARKRRAKVRGARHSRRLRHGEE